MKVLMFGWEFPPMFAGGVGMVCYELTKELADQGVTIDYLLPFFPNDVSHSFLNLYNAKDKQGKLVYDRSDYVISSSKSSDLSSVSSHVNLKKVHSMLGAYQTQEQYEEIKSLLDERPELINNSSLKSNCSSSVSSSSSSHSPSSVSSSNVDSDDEIVLYGENLLDEVALFAKRVEAMYDEGDESISDFDVIHAHDWTTLSAAKVLSEKTGKPFIAHVHITEINKSAGHGVNQEIYDVERIGFEAADKLIAVSGAIKKTLVDNYGIYEGKIEVVHNAGIDLPESVMGKTEKTLSSKEQRKKIEEYSRIYHKKKGEQLVSFMGRITGMKGPENFVLMAKKVLEHKPKTKFLMAGTGDKLPAAISLSKQLGIYNNFYFHGFYDREEASHYFSESDVFVLPSLMEPFGVTPLEAMQKNTPVIISKQSGVSEILTHCYKVDFWDIDKMASNVLSILTYPALAKEMTSKGFVESKSKTWKDPALECRRIYDSLTQKNVSSQKKLINSNSNLNLNSNSFNTKNGEVNSQYKTQGGQVK